MEDKKRKAQYDMAYARKNIRRKEIPFNLTQPEDEELFRHLESQGNYTQYIKDLIRKDMEEKKPDNITFPAVDGYRDEESIRECFKEQHKVFVKRIGKWELRIDLDARKVLTVNDLNNTTLEL